MIASAIIKENIAATPWKEALELYQKIELDQPFTEQEILTIFALFSGKDETEEFLFKIIAMVQSKVPLSKGFWGLHLKQLYLSSGNEAAVKMWNLLNQKKLWKLESILENPFFFAAWFEKIQFSTNSLQAKLAEELYSALKDNCREYLSKEMREKIEQENRVETFNRLLNNLTIENFINNYLPLISFCKTEEEKKSVRETIELRFSSLCRLKIRWDLLPFFQNPKVQEFAIGHQKWFLSLHQKYISIRDLEEKKQWECVRLLITYLKKNEDERERDSLNQFCMDIMKFVTQSYQFLYVLELSEMKGNVNIQLWEVLLHSVNKLGNLFESAQHYEVKKRIIHLNKTR